MFESPMMNRMITVEQLKKIVPLCSDPETIVKLLNTYGPVFGIDTKQELGMFVAQTAHESGSYNQLRENMNYSADTLKRVFPKYFPTQALANAYARQPEKIANKVYANRMGNGSESSGDGWRYRGRGYIQITGKDNYVACAKGIGKKLEELPDFLETKPGAMMSAMWWYHNAGLVGKTDIVTVTKKINGGTNGLTERKLFYSRAKSVLGF